MKRIIKSQHSKVLQENLIYKKGDNSKLTSILLKEQKYFCAYTEEYFGINDSADIEHFNPHLKYQEGDCYNNWFMVKHKSNNKKRTQWIEPILHPTDKDFENRILYLDGVFIHNPEDREAKNLIELLNLNQENFVKNRKKYIQRRRERIQESYKTAIEYFQEKIDKEIDTIKYLRAIQEEFNIDIWNMIPEPK